jgi:hypothetical protein
MPKVDKQVPMHGEREKQGKAEKGRETCGMSVAKSKSGN